MKLGKGKLYFKPRLPDGTYGPEKFVSDVEGFTISVRGPATLREAISEIRRFTNDWRQSNVGLGPPQLYLDCDKVTRDELKNDADRHMPMGYVQRNPDKPIELEICGAKVRVVNREGMRVSTIPTPTDLTCCVNTFGSKGS